VLENDNPDAPNFFAHFSIQYSELEIQEEILIGALAVK
jgi:hypothetical protein